MYKLFDGVKEQYGNTLFDSRLVMFGIDPKKPTSEKSSPHVSRKDTGTGNIHHGKGVYGRKKVADHGDAVKEATELTNTGAINMTADKDSNHNADSRVDHSDGDGIVVTTGLNDRDSGKGDSLDSRKSDVCRDPLQAGDAGDESVDSDQSSEHCDEVTNDDKANHQKQCQGHTVGTESSKEITNDVNNTETKPRSSSNVSTESTTSSTGSVVKDAPSNVIFYPDVDQCSDLERCISEFIDSLFWVLESKRLDRSQERLDKLPMLATPFEKKDLVGVDTDSRWVDWLNWLKNIRYY